MKPFVSSDKVTVLKHNYCFDGVHLQCEHQSEVTNTTMRFAVFLPTSIVNDENDLAPVFYWLSGLTCTDENFMQKAGAMRVASELGMVIVAPDTSPRGEGVADDDNGAYDFGLGAGFYVNATQAPFDKHYRMYDYVVSELPELIESSFAVTDERTISGHSMGGHGALTIALKNPNRYCAVSALSPIVNPMNCPWGQKAFSGYLGEDKATWAEYDATELLKNHDGRQVPMLVDQGGADEFLVEQLKPEALIAVATAQNYPLNYRLHAGYDHSYYFIASFIEDHLLFHAQHLA